MKSKNILILALLLCFGSAARTNADAAADKKIEVVNVQGEKTRPLDGSDRIATVLLFIAQDCPISNSYAPEFNAIYNDYARHHVAFYIVYTETDSTLAAARKHAKDFNYACPALYDSKHKLVKRVGASVTPEVSVLGPNGNTLYQGRIDDKYIDFGKTRHTAAVHDLRRTLDEIVLNKPITVSKTKAVGCFIMQTK